MKLFLVHLQLLFTVALPTRNFPVNGQSADFGTLEKNEVPVERNAQVHNVWEDHRSCLDQLTLELRSSRRWQCNSKTGEILKAMEGIDERAHRGELRAHILFTWNHDEVKVSAVYQFHALINETYAYFMLDRSA
jgi:hypothetical protein